MIVRYNIKQFYFPKFVIKKLVLHFFLEEYTTLWYKIYTLKVRKKRRKITKLIYFWPKKLSIIQIYTNNVHFVQKQDYIG